MCVRARLCVCVCVRAARFHLNAWNDFVLNFPFSCIRMQHIRPTHTHTHTLSGFELLRSHQQCSYVFELFHCTIGFSKTRIKLLKRFIYIINIIWKILKYGFQAFPNHTKQHKCKMLQKQTSAYVLYAHINKCSKYLIRNKSRTQCALSIESAQCVCVTLRSRCAFLSHDPP